MSIKARQVYPAAREDKLDLHIAHISIDKAFLSEGRECRRPKNHML